MPIPRPVKDHGLTLERTGPADPGRGHDAKVAKCCQRYSPRVRADAASAILESSGGDLPLALVNSKSWRRATRACKRR
jgi:hypothetical protein